jgi:hypothetical protein
MAFITSSILEKKVKEQNSVHIAKNVKKRFIFRGFYLPIVLLKTCQALLKLQLND